MAQINPFELEELPVETQCYIVSQVTDIKEIQRLWDVSEHMRSLLRRCVHTINGGSLEWILRLDSLQRVTEGNVIFESIGELMMIANHPNLRQADFYDSIILGDLDNNGYIILFAHFVKQHCSGYYTDGEGFPSQHNRTMKDVRFHFHIYSYLSIGFDYGLLSVDTEHQLKILPLIRALAAYKSLRGIALHSPLIEEEIQVIIEAPEFNEVHLSVYYRNYVGLFNDSVRVLLHANKIEILEDDQHNQDYEPDPFDSHSLMEILLPAPPRSRLRVLKEVVPLDRIVDLLKAYPKLEEVMIQLTYEDDVEEVTKQVEDLLKRYKRIKVLHIAYVNVAHIEDDDLRALETKSLYDKFMKLYTGPTDRIREYN